MVCMMRCMLLTMTGYGFQSGRVHYTPQVNLYVGRFPRALGLGIFLLPLVSGISTRIALWRDTDEVREDISIKRSGFRIPYGGLICTGFLYPSEPFAAGLLGLRLQGGSSC